MLETKIRPNDHPDLLGAMYIDCTNKGVNKLNLKRLNEINSEIIEIEAINLHPTIKEFSPPISKKGTVKDTPFQQTLKLKISAKVMLTFNIDILLETN